MKSKAREKNLDSSSYSVSSETEQNFSLLERN